MLLLTGSNGQLATCLKPLLEGVVCATSSDLDIGCEDSVKRYVEQHKITKIINCAAYTAVDDAESHQDIAYRVNVQGPKNLAKTGLPVMHFSTDYVFDGHHNQPYTEDDTTNPLSVYALTKLKGEDALLEKASSAIIIRSAWLHSEHGRNFAKTIRQLGSQRELLKVVHNQVGTPTYAGHLAQVSVKLLDHLTRGTHEVLHFSNEGVCSWYDFAHAIIEMSNANCRVLPIESKDYPVKAERPLYSVLDKTKIKDILGIEIPHWHDGLKETIRNLPPL